MFTEEHRFGLAMLKPYHSMFPVANVIAETNVEDSVSKVVAVEEEPECVHHAITLIHHY